MLTPSQYDAIADQIVDLYSKLNESIVEDIARRIMKTGTISESAKWQIRQLQESGMLYNDILSEIARQNNQTEQVVRSLFQSAGIQSVRNDNIFYKPTGNQVLRLSDSALQVLNAGYQKCAGNLQNLTLTTANNAQQLYLDACNLAYLQVTSGAMDYGTAIRRAVQMASQQGSMVSYPSGHRDQLDVAVRRAVLTGVGQTVRQISVINANDMGCDLMEITAHAGARPSHAHWQGQIVSLSGRRGYLTVRDIGYGDADGFGGINCRHDWYPFFEGISQRTYSPERLQELENHRIQIGDKSYTDYEVSQMQRRLERDIREKKRLVAGARASVDSAPDESTKKQMQELFTNASVRLKKAEQKLNDFCNQTGFRKDNNRVWVNGFGRSTSQKAVWANRKALKNKVHPSLFTSMLEEYNNGQKDVIKFRNIEKELEKSEIGKEYKKYLLENPCKINIFYNVDVDSELLGTYDAINDEVNIYASNTKSIARTAEVIIHELTHRRYQIWDCYWAECVCRSHEYMHRFRKNSLTEAERRSIIKEIKEAYAPLYPDWKWK